MRSLLFISLLFPTALYAQEQKSTKADEALVQELDQLGGNSALLERAQRLNPEKKIEIVQDRMVNRRWRHELGLEYGGVVGGDAYLATENLSLNYQLHIVPQFSIGVRGTYHMNRLREEGKYLIAKAQELEEGVKNENVKNELKTLGLIPEIDHPRHTGYLMANYYPFYGKLNLANLGIAQYDLYFLSGVGQIALKSGNTLALTAGGGIGFWLTQSLTSRFEVRYETYEAQRSAGKERMNMTTLGLTMGVLL